MTRKITAALTLGTALSFAGPAFAQSGEAIQMAGSSTVLPYAQIVAENFGEVFPDYPTPIVESGGTGGGFTQFCQGVGPNTTDISNASRQIRASELKACMDAGVTEVHEIKFGYDGIVFASAASGPDFALTPETVFRAMAAQLPQDGEVVANPNSNWSDIDPSLPEQQITAFIPASNHGTREVFEEKLMMAGCEESGVMQEFIDSGMDEDAAEEACMEVRNDGAVSEISGDYTETLARIDANEQAVGVFGLAFYEQNQDRLKVATINDVTPSAEAIASGEYPVSRPLFFYVKMAHVGVVPGLSEYVSFFLDEQMTGEGSPTVNYGLVPLPQDEREEEQQSFQNGDTITEADLG